MSYENEIYQDDPYAFHNANELAGATPVPPLVAGGVTASRFAGGSASFTFPSFVQSLRHKPFSLEAWFFPLTSNSIILGHAEGDGILWDNGNIVFRIKTTAGDVDVSYRPSQRQNFHVIAQYSRYSIGLYVNGEKVADRELTEDEQAAPLVTFAAETTLVTSGSHIIDSIALYTKSVPGGSPASHYARGTKTPMLAELIGSMGGGIVEPLSDKVFQLQERSWSADTWQEGLLTGTKITNDGLMAQEVGGTWKGNFFTADAPNVWLDWVSYGNVTVETSDDEVSWTTYNSPALIPTSTQVFIRITFADTGSRVVSLNAHSADSQELYAVGIERYVALGGFAPSPEPFYPLDAKERAGAVGVLSVQAGTQPLRAFEFWIRPTTATTVSAVTSAVGTNYVNGLAGSNLRAEEWSHVVVVTPSDSTVTRQFTGRIGYVALYPNALTAGQVSDLYNGYFSQNPASVLAGGANIGTSTPELYSREWVIVTSG